MSKVKMLTKISRGGRKMSKGVWYIGRYSIKHQLSGGKMKKITAVLRTVLLAAAVTGYASRIRETIFA